jgi:hypothetical protein
MNPEVKARWVAALRSGEYRQGFGRLRRPEIGDAFCFCALGALIDLAAQEGKVTWVQQCKESLFAPHPAVHDWVGFGEEDVWEEVIRMNDDELEPFDAIADWIDANL